MLQNHSTLSKQMCLVRFWTVQQIGKDAGVWIGKCSIVVQLLESLLLSHDSISGHSQQADAAVVWYCWPQPSTTWQYDGSTNIAVQIRGAQWLKQHIKLQN